MRTKRMLALLLAVLMLCGLLPVTGAAGLDTPNKADVTIAEGVFNPAIGRKNYVHFPDIVKLGDDTLLVAYYENTVHAPSSSAQPFGEIKLVRSADHGRSWSEPTLVMNAQKLWDLGIKTTDGLMMEARDPNFALLDDGTVLLTFFVRRYGGEQAGSLRAYVMESADGGATWENPVLIQSNRLDGWYCKRGNIAVFPDGQLLIPLYGGGSGFPSGSTVALNVLATRTGPNTWTWDDERYLADSVTLGVALNEVSLVHPAGDAAQNTVYAFAREPGTVWKSSDRGATWRVIGSQGRLHQPGLIPLPDGRIFATWSRDPGGRRPIYGKMYDPNLGWDATEERLIFKEVNPAGTIDMADPSAVLTGVENELLTIWYNTTNFAIEGSFSQFDEWLPMEQTGEGHTAAFFNSNFESIGTGAYNGDGFFSKPPASITVASEDDGGTANQYLRFHFATAGGSAMELTSPTEISGNMTAQFDFRLNQRVWTAIYFSSQQGVTQLEFSSSSDDYQLKWNTASAGVKIPQASVELGKWYTLKYVRAGRVVTGCLYEKGGTEPLMTTVYRADDARINLPGESLKTGPFRLAYYVGGGAVGTMDVDNLSLTKQVSGMEMSHASLSGVAGGLDSRLSVAVPSGMNAEDLVWSSSNDSIAAVDQSGLVSFRSPGTAVITASLLGLTAECTVTVLSPAPAETNLLNFFALDLSRQAAGNVFSDAFLEVFPSGGATVTVREEDGEKHLELGRSAALRSRGDDSLISGDYMATYQFRFPAGSSGYQEIYTGLRDQAPGSGSLERFIFNVRASDQTVYFNPYNSLVDNQKTEIVLGRWYNLKLERAGEITRIRIWQDGTPEPPSWTLSTTYPEAGRTGKLRIAFYGGVATTPHVDIRDIRLWRKAEVSLPASLSGYVGQSSQLNITYSPDISANSPLPAVSWSSSNESVAEVSQSGLVSFKAAGTAQITARTGGQALTCQVSVTSEPSPGGIFSLEGLSLTGSARITGNVRTNSAAADSISFAWSTGISGDLLLGPGADPARVIQGARPDAAAHVTGEIGELDAPEIHPMPVFPEPPELPHKGTLTAGYGPKDVSTVGESGAYDGVSVTNRLTVNVGDEDVVLKTGSLSVTGSGRLSVNRTGGGRLILYVTDGLSLSGSGGINAGGDPDGVVLYYAGSGAVSLGGSTRFAGSLIAERAPVSLGGSANVTGNLVTGGGAITVEGNAAASVGVLYAPAAQLRMGGSASVKGAAVVARDLQLSGSSRIESVDFPIADFLKQLF